MTDLIARLSGIVTVLNTPFTADDHIDTDALRANVQKAITAGVSGFLVPAMASEVSKLNEAERDLLVKTTVEAVQGRAAVIGGASSPHADERQRMARALIERGCDGILVSIPYDDDASYTQQVKALAELKPGFLMLQDWDFGGYGLPVPLLLWLFEAGYFQSLKVEVVPAGVKYSEVLQATNGALHVAGGWAVMQMIEALQRGVHTLMPTGMHHIYTRIYTLYTAGQHEAATTLFRRLLPVLAFSNQHLDISVHFFKRLLHRQGVYGTDFARSPILPFDHYHEQVANELIDYVMALEAELANDGL